MRKLPRDPGRLGSLFLFDKLDRLRESDLELDDPARIDAVVNDIGRWLRGVLADPQVIRGWWAQGLFAAVIVAIGEVRLIQELDSGDLWFADAEPDGMSLPDFLVVTGDGRRLVVEVKAVSSKVGSGTYTLPKKDGRRLRAYAAAVGAEPYVATFWQDWHLWALVPVDVMDTAVTLPDVMKSSEMNAVGDHWLGTRAPLSAVISVSSGERVAVDDDQFEVDLTINDFALYMGRLKVTEANEERLAFFLMFYGSWEETEHVDVDDDGSITAIRYTYQPPDADNENHQEVDLLGPLSSMYSRYYQGATKGQSGRIGKLGLDADPDMLRELIPEEYHGQALHIWRIRVQATSTT